MATTRKLRTIALGIALMDVGGWFGPGAVFAQAPEAQLASRQSEAGPPEKSSRLRSATDKFPLYFVQNKGQVDARVDYYVQGKDKIVYFTPDGLTLVLHDASRHKPQYASVNENSLIAESSTNEPASLSPRRLAVKLEFVGSDSRVRPQGEEMTPALISYFVGPEAQWKTGLKTYRRLVYRDLWPGIDLVYSGTVQRLKYMFIVNPGADPKRIRLRYRGADAVIINGGGQLEVQTALGAFQDDNPSAYQEVEGGAVDVSVGYGIETQADSDSYQYGFRIGSYDPALPLIIDPTLLVYAGFVGGAGDDRGAAIAVDGAKNAYITGETSSSELTFPDGDGFGAVPGRDRTQNGGVDAFVAKVSADGTALLYASYIGGSGDDKGKGIALQPGESGCPPACSVYIVGETSSTQATFPTTTGPDLTHNGGIDAFVAKIDPTGTTLVYAGYVGGLLDDRGNGIAVDAAANAYVTGETSSTQATFPDGNGFNAVPGFDQTHNGGVDAFVAAVNAAGTALLYATYVGGALDDRGNGIAVDSVGNAYITGETNSTEVTFPDGNGFNAVPGFDRTHNGGVDAFVAAVDAAGTALLYATYMGGSGDDQGKGVALDTNADVYVVGETNSTEATFPDGDGIGSVQGPDRTQNLGVDAFVAKICSAVCANLMVTISDSPDPVRAGDPSDPLTYTITVTNNGPSNATGVLLTDTLPAGVVFVPASSSGSCVEIILLTVNCALGPLSIGGSATVTIVVNTTVQGTLVNTVSVAADQADPDMRDNTDTERTVATLANLIVKKIKTVTVAIPDSTIVINDTTTNNGKVTAGASVTQFYLSKDSTFDVGDTFLGERSIPSLPAKASSSGSTTVTIDSGTALGAYSLIAVADATNVVAETSSNNKKTQNLTVARPDLSVSSVKSPSSAAAGSTIVVQDTTSNQALVPAGASTTKFYLSTDALFDGGDTLLVNSRIVPALPAKGKSVASTPVTIPPSTTPGVYFLLAVADGDGAVVETNEANNLLSRQITITP